MNIRQQKYKNNRLLGMNQHNAAIAAGYSEKYAKQACRIEKLVKVSLTDVFERAGLTDKAIVVHALQGLTATKLRVCDLHISKNEDGELKVNENSNDFIEIEDWNIRHKYFTTICELTDRLKNKIEHSGKIEGAETKIVVIYPQQKEQVADNPQTVSSRLSE